MMDEEVTIEGAVSLGATLTYADKDSKHPAIVIIMGTGKLDRDGNGGGFKLNLYKDLAWMLADQGFVVVRYDKRGTHRSGGDFNTAGLSDLTDDAISVVRYMKALPYVDDSKVIVCGHSEGTMIATLLSEKEDVAGLILLGGAGVSLKDALRYQSMLAGKEFESKKGIKGALLRRLSSEDKINSNQDEMFSKADASDGDTMRFKGMKMSAKWLREHESHTSEDYVRILKDCGKPVLAITGTADVQADYHALEAFGDAGNVTVYAPERVNHILREIDDDNEITGLSKQYKRLASRPIYEGIKHIIRSWLEQFNRSLVHFPNESTVLPATELFLLLFLIHHLDHFSDDLYDLAPLIRDDYNAGIGAACGVHLQKTQLMELFDLVAHTSAS